MLETPFEHLAIVPPSARYEQKTATIAERLQKFEMLTKANIDVNSFIGPWMILLFTQTLQMRDVLYVWKNALERMKATCMSLHDCWIDYCVSIAALTLPNCQKKTETEIIAALQKAKELTGEAIVLAPTAASPAKRRGKKPDRGIFA
jgi:hypothetical protein